MMIFTSDCRIIGITNIRICNFAHLYTDLPTGRLLRWLFIAYFVNILTCYFIPSMTVSRADVNVICQLFVHYMLPTCMWSNVLFAVIILCRRGFYVGAGRQLPPATLALPQMCTNSKHLRVGAKKTFCGLQQKPKCVSDRGLARAPLWELTTIIQTS